MDNLKQSLNHLGFLNDEYNILYEKNLDNNSTIRIRFGGALAELKHYDEFYPDKYFRMPFNYKQENWNNKLLEDVMLLIIDKHYNENGKIN